MEELKALPDGWAQTTLGEILLDPKKDLVDGPFGSNLKSNEYIESGIPVFKIQNIKANRFVDKKIDFITQEKADSISRHSFQAGDLIITKLGNPLGLCCKVPEKYKYGIIVADLMRLRPSSIVANTEFLIFLINSRIIQHQFQAITKGTTRSRVNLTIVREIIIPLPPLPEQHRIVAKIEELFSSLDKGIESLKTAQAQLKTYRQAVLKWAFEGKLTNENVKDGELPEGWKCQRLGNEVDMQSGVAFKKSEYSTAGVRLFQIANVSFNYVKWEEIEHLPNDYIVKYPELLLNAGDIVMALNRPMLNNQLKIAEIKRNDIPAILYQRVGRFKFLGNLNNKYFLYYLQSPKFTKWLSDELQGVNIPFINKSKLMDYNKLPLPRSLPEQTRIVSEIETRLSVCDKLEESITQSLLQAESLRQSILKKAFEGRLAPQDPNDAPASILLERIRAERALVIAKKATASNGKKGKGRSK